MDWTLKDNTVDGLFFCATLSDRRGGHTPFVQGVETPDAGAEAVEPDPGCQWLIQEFSSGGINHLMYVRLFRPFISKQLKIGMTRQ